MTSNDNQAYSGNLVQKELVPGAYGITAADGNANGQVKNPDRNEICFEQDGYAGYYNGDYIMNGNIDSQDILLWEEGAGKSEHMPD